MGPKEQAESLFSYIGYGRENAVNRPTNRTVDRYLRDLVAQADKTKVKVEMMKAAFMKDSPGYEQLSLPV